MLIILVLLNSFVFPGSEYCIKVLDQHQPYKKSVPVGPLFQADIPEWSDQSTKNNDHRTEYENKWLGTRLWPLHETAEQQMRMNEINITEQECTCSVPGSVDCINVHVLHEKGRLMKELGPAFWEMKIHETGQMISIFWNQDEKKVLEKALNSNPPRQEKNCFVKTARKRLEYQTRVSILRYYYNVYLPKKISRRIKSGFSIVNSDDEEEAAMSLKKKKKYVGHP